MRVLRRMSSHKVQTFRPLSQAGKEFYVALNARAPPLWGAHASRPAPAGASASSRSRTFLSGLAFGSRDAQAKFVSTRRRNQHARRVRFPERHHHIVELAG